mgnify:CR=1 FL=1
MKQLSLASFLEEYLNWALAGMSEATAYIDADDLANKLEQNGYCADTSIDYLKTLCCPVNKRKEASCNLIHCKSHEFCCLLRKEGYLK